MAKPNRNMCCSGAGARDAQVPGQVVLRCMGRCCQVQEQWCSGAGPVVPGAWVPFVQLERPCVGVPGAWVLLGVWVAHELSFAGAGGCLGGWMVWWVAFPGFPVASGGASARQPPAIFRLGLATVEGSPDFGVPFVRL